MEALIGQTDTPKESLHELMAHIAGSGERITSLIAVLQKIKKEPGALTI